MCQLTAAETNLAFEYPHGFQVEVPQTLQVGFQGQCGCVGASCVHPLLPHAGEAYAGPRPLGLQATCAATSRSLLSGAHVIKQNDVVNLLCREFCLPSGP